MKSAILTVVSLLLASSSRAQNKASCTASIPELSAAVTFHGQPTAVGVLAYAMALNPGECSYPGYGSSGLGCTGVRFYRQSVALPVAVDSSGVVKLGPGEISMGPLCDPLFEIVLIINPRRLDASNYDYLDHADVPGQDEFVREVIHPDWHVKEASSVRLSIKFDKFEKGRPYLDGPIAYDESESFRRGRQIKIALTDLMALEGVPYRMDGAWKIKDSRTELMRPRFGGLDESQDQCLQRLAGQELPAKIYGIPDEDSRWFEVSDLSDETLAACQKTLNAGQIGAKIDDFEILPQ